MLLDKCIYWFTQSNTPGITIPQIMVIHNSVHFGGVYPEKEMPACHSVSSLAIKAILSEHRFTSKLKSEEEID